MRPPAPRGLRRALLVVALSVPLVACGGEPTAEDYCEQLAADRQELADLVSSGSPTALLSGLDLLDELGAQAPRDLRDEWDTLTDALHGLQDALDEAGVAPSDFEDGEPPEGLAAPDREAVATAADRLRAPDVVEAAAGIETQARDVCKVNLGL
ncbi:hypothetical protein [Nocardioides aequoreus]|uniref:hypothetical protein n=1 Tax=Nocardioides aequoreus TaxID=397278 RepID=UPI0004C457DF|nr:hypothetical protein [Nocardioides aequoreus]